MWTWIQAPPEWVRRALRTFGQTFLGTAVALWLSGNFSVIDQATGAIVPAWHSLDTLVISAGTAAVVAVLSLLQNLLEDKSGSEGFIVKK